MITFSNKVRVTDPCYDRDTWSTVIDVKPGEYEASVEMSDQGSWGNRVASLSVKRINDAVSHIYDSGTVIDVDSGQAGFFCDSTFPYGDTGEFDDMSTFYGRCCDATLRKVDVLDAKTGRKVKREVLSFGEIDDTGVVSSSGFGDGSYSLYLGKNSEGKVVFLEIRFIEDEEEEEEEEEDEGEEEEEEEEFEDE